MSLARSVPAFIVEKSAPWMNGTASAKATKESVGKPGSFVEASSPPEFTSRSMIGKINGKTTEAGCRTVRRIERRASALTCAANPEPGLMLSSRGRLGRVGLLFARPLERAARLRAEDAVERRSLDLEARERQAGVVDRANDGRKPGKPLAEPDRDVAGAVAHGFAERGELGDEPRPFFLVGRDRVHARKPDLRLQLGRRALGDDRPVVDDPDPVGEHVRLLEVLRRQKDRHSFLAGEPGDLIPERRPALRVEPGRRLVEEEDPRPVHERERQVEPALHPARVTADLAVGRLAQADALEELVRARLALGAGDP